MHATLSETHVRVAQSEFLCSACGETIILSPPGAALECPPTCGPSCRPIARRKFQLLGGCFQKLMIRTATIRLTAGRLELDIWWPDRSGRSSRFETHWSDDDSNGPVVEIQKVIEQTQSHPNVFRWLGTGSITTAAEPVIREVKCGEYDLPLFKALECFPDIRAPLSLTAKALKSRLNQSMKDILLALNRGDGCRPSSQFSVGELKSARNVILQYVESGPDRNRVNSGHRRARGVAGVFLYESDDCRQGFSIWNPIH